MPAGGTPRLIEQMAHLAEQDRDAFILLAGEMALFEYFSTTHSNTTQ
jgi:hypothetical protein